MLSSKTLKEIVSEARPIIERQLDDAEMIAGLREVVASNGGDWSALKALIKAQIQDERDETGNGKRVAKILEKAGFSTGYADMLGWSKMNERNFSAEEEFDAETGEVVDDTQFPEREQSRGNGSRDHQHAHSRQTDGAKHGGQDGVPAGADHVPNSPETVEQAEPDGAAVTAGNDLREPAAAERGQIIREGDAPRETDRFGGDASCSDTDQPETAPSFLVKPPSPLRPHCRQPEACGGYGRNHCHTCAKAMREQEEMA